MAEPYRTDLQPQSRYQGAPHSHPKRYKKSNRARLGIAIILIIVVIAAAAIILNGFGSGNIISINSPQTVAITKLGTVMQLNNSVYVAVFAGTFGAGTAYMELTRVPVFLNPTLNITLNQNSITHVNYNSQYAIVSFELKNFTNNSASVSVVPISAGLSISPDSSKIRIVPNFLIFTSGNTPTTGTTTAATTATTTTSTTSTSTIKQLTVQEKVTNVLQKSLYYPLMLNYSTLYANTVNCTPGLYNITYGQRFAQAPSGQSTYRNVSSLIPYALTLNITGSSSRYSAKYITKSRSDVFNNQPALEVGINLTTNTITSTQLEGIFLGLNYTLLSNGYRQAVLIGNACGVYVAG